MSTTRESMQRHGRKYHRRERHGGRVDHCRDYECKWIRSYLAERFDCPHGDLYPASEQACHEEVTR